TCLKKETFLIIFYTEPYNKYHCIDVRDKPVIERVQKIIKEQPGV
ncbi:unnamed protein product, partial [marine sediment metagenome]